MSADCETQLAQETIYNAVEARGYTNGYRPEELAGRQVLKAIEELAEAFAHLYPLMATDSQQATYEDLRDMIATCGSKARALFDSGMRMGVYDVPGFAVELADIAVPLFVAAQAVRIDLICAAVEKATADVKRGVR